MPFAQLAGVEPKNTRVFLPGEEVLVKADGSKFTAIVKDYNGMYTVEFDDGEVRGEIEPDDVMELDD